jgi:hypothetical protein
VTTMLPRKRITPNKWTILNASKDIGLALLWQIYSRCVLAQIRFRQWGHRCGGGRAMSATMA